MFQRGQDVKQNKNFFSRIEGGWISYFLLQQLDMHEEFENM